MKTTTAKKSITLATKTATDTIDIPAGTNVLAELAWRASEARRCGVDCRTGDLCRQFLMSTVETTTLVAVYACHEDMRVGRRELARICLRPGDTMLTAIATMRGVYKMPLPNGIVDLVGLMRMGGAA